MNCEKVQKHIFFKSQKSRFTQLHYNTRKFWSHLKTFIQIHKRFNFHPNSSYILVQIKFYLNFPMQIKFYNNSRFQVTIQAKKQASNFRIEFLILDHYVKRFGKQDYWLAAETHRKQIHEQRTQKEYGRPWKSRQRNGES